MYSHLRIDNDPHSWLLEAAIDVARLTESSEPLALRVTRPIEGTLLLSRRSAASVVLLPPPPLEIPPPLGWIPTDVTLPRPRLYLPSAARPVDDADLYTLPGSVDPADLIHEITSAMREGTFVVVDIVDDGGNGVLVLNGAALSFAVVSPVPG